MRVHLIASVKSYWVKYTFKVFKIQNAKYSFKNFYFFEILLGLGTKWVTAK